jgi:hypothetical protein
MEPKPQACASVKVLSWGIALFVSLTIWTMVGFTVWEFLH